MFVIAVAKISILGYFPKNPIFGYFAILGYFGHFGRSLHFPHFPYFPHFSHFGYFGYFPIFGYFGIFGHFGELGKNGENRIVVIVWGNSKKWCFLGFPEIGWFWQIWKNVKKVKNVKNSDFLVNMKYAVFCCFWIICIWYKCGKCDILQNLYGGNVNFVIVENKKNNFHQ